MTPIQIWRKLRRGDDGLTLTEMIVSITMLSLIMGALASTVVITQRFSARNGSYLADADQGRNAIEGISKTLRTAVLPSQLQDNLISGGDANAAFIQGTTTSVQFYADLDTPTVRGPSKVSYSVQANADGTGDLIESIEPPDTGAVGSNYTWNNTSTARVRTLAHGLTYPSPTIFTYYDNSGAAMTTPLSTTAAAANNIENVRTMDVVLTVKTVSGVSHLPTTYVQRVALPNVDVLPSSSPTP